MVSYIGAKPGIYADDACIKCSDKLKTDVMVHDKKNKGASGPQWQCPVHKKCLQAWVKVKKECPNCKERVNMSSIFSTKDKCIEWLQISAQGVVVGLASFALMDLAEELHQNDPQSLLPYIPAGIFIAGCMGDLMLNAQIKNSYVGVISCMTGTSLRWSPSAFLSNIVVRSLISATSSAISNACLHKAFKVMGED